MGDPSFANSNTTDAYDSPQVAATDCNSDRYEAPTTNMVPLCTPAKSANYAHPKRKTPTHEQRTNAQSTAHKRPQKKENPNPNVRKPSMLQLYNVAT
jgi:hypothetical protein